MILQSLLRYIKKIIIKPTELYGGKNVRRLSKNDKFESLLYLYDNGFIMEPIIENENPFKKINRESLNTIRIAAVLLNNRVEIAFVFATLVCKGSLIDNAKCGGIISVIDIETGIITAACDKKRNYYIKHADSKQKIIGYELQKWEEAKKLVKEFALVVPVNRYTG